MYVLLLCMSSILVFQSKELQTESNVASLDHSQTINCWEVEYLFTTIDKVMTT